MKDEAYVAELLAILTNDYPTGIDPDDSYGMADDGIDRYDGFGRDVVVTSLDVQPGAHGDEIGVGFRLPATGQQGVVWLPFDREWRDLSGYAQPAAFAPWVATRVEVEAHRFVSPPDPRVQEVVLPPRNEQWRMLKAELDLQGRTTETAPGRFEVVVQEGTEAEQTVTVVISPGEWEEVLRRNLTCLDIEFADAFGPLDEDDRFIVAYRGTLERSIREELPPVPGWAFGRELDALRDSRGPRGPEDGWVAYGPRE